MFLDKMSSSFWESFYLATSIKPDWGELEYFWDHENYASYVGWVLTFNDKGKIPKIFSK